MSNFIRTQGATETRSAAYQIDASIVISEATQ